jgi:hypothetical protein
MYHLQPTPSSLLELTPQSYETLSFRNVICGMMSFYGPSKKKNHSGKPGVKID